MNVNEGSHNSSTQPQDSQVRKLVIGDIVASEGAQVNIAAGDIVQYIQNITNQLPPLLPLEQLKKDQEIELHSLEIGLQNTLIRLRYQAEFSPEDNVPFQGLLPYQIRDVARFIGRDDAIRHLGEALRRGPMVVFHGASGSGKTSLIQAGLVPRILRGEGLPLVIRFGFADPIQAIKRTFLPDFNNYPGLVKSTLREFLEQVLRALGNKIPICVFFDQFEEVLQRWQDREEEYELFAQQFGECVNDVSLPIQWVIIVRNEHLADMEHFYPYLRDPLVNRCSLLPLDRQTAVNVFNNAAKTSLWTFSPDVVGELLDDLGGETIAPSQLQLVGQALVGQAELLEHEVIGLPEYDALGRTSGILENYLSRVIDELPSQDQRIARLSVEALTTSEHRRAIKSRISLQAELVRFRVDPGQVPKVIDRLVDRRLVSPVDIPGWESDGGYYELVHDYLAESIKLDQDVIERKYAEELAAQSLENWQRSIRANRVPVLPGPDVLTTISSHQNVIYLSEETLGLFIRSAAWYEQPTSSWFSCLNQQARKDLATQLNIESESDNDRLREIASKALWAVRSELKLGQAAVVATRQTVRWTKRRMAALFLALLAILAVILMAIKPFYADWLHMPDIENQPFNNTLIAVDPNNWRVLYAISSDQGFYRFDGNWVLMPDSPWGENPLVAIAANGQYLFAATVSDLFYSSDGGISWQIMNHPDLVASISALAVRPTQSETILLGLENGGLMFLNGQSGWKLLPQPPEHQSPVNSMAMNGHYILVGNEKGLWRAEWTLSSPLDWQMITLEGCLASSGTQSILSLALPQEDSNSFVALINDNSSGKTILCDGNAGNTTGSRILFSLPSQMSKFIAVGAKPSNSNDYSVIYLSTNDQLYCRRTFLFTDWQAWVGRIPWFGLQLISCYP